MHNVADNIWGTLKWAAICCVFLSCSRLLAQDDATSVSGAPVADSGAVAAVSGDDELQKLVQTLGSPVFRERQAAMQELMTLGPKSIGALEEGIRTGSPEVRARATEILNQIRSTAFQQRLERLKTELTTEAASELPEWERYTAAVGRDSEDIARYRKLVESETELFATDLLNPAGVPAELERRASALAAIANDRESARFPVESYMAVLLVASRDGVRLPRATSTHLTTILNDTRVQESLGEGADGDAYRRIIGLWMLRSGIAADRLLKFAVTFEIPEGRILAERIIKSKSVRPEMIFAVLALKELGPREENLRLVESLLDTDTVLWPTGNRAVRREGNEEGTSNYQLQTRDVALAVALYLRRRSPSATRSDSVAGFSDGFGIDTMGFESNEKRTAAIEAYRRQFLSNSPDPNGPDPN